LVLRAATDNYIVAVPVILYICVINLASDLRIKAYINRLILTIVRTKDTKVIGGWRKL
jgi:hypothetical protein